MVETHTNKWTITILADLFSLVILWGFEKLNCSRVDAFVAVVHCLLHLHGPDHGGRGGMIALAVGLRPKPDSTSR